jgi:hypothetical protein
MKNYFVLLFAIILLSSCSKSDDQICTAENETGQFITSNIFSSDLDGAETIWNFSPNGTLRTYPPGTDNETFINIYEWEWWECDILRITLIGHQYSNEIIYSIPDYYYIIDLHFASYENEVISATYNPLKPGIKSTFFNLIKK